MKYLVLAAYIATIPAANWMIGNVGICGQGPCVLPVGFGLMAPSGVYLIGLAMVLRDMVQEQMGKGWALGAIAIGAVLSAAVAAPGLVLASVAAFALSELLDMAVYTPLRRWSAPVAVLASGLVGAAVDSAAFLLIAFGSLQFIEGQIVGKLWGSLAAAAAVYVREGLIRRPEGV